MSYPTHEPPVYELGGAVGHLEIQDLYHADGYWYPGRVLIHSEWLASGEVRSRRRWLKMNEPMGDVPDILDLTHVSRIGNAPWLMSMFHRHGVLGVIYTVVTRRGVAGTRTIHEVSETYYLALLNELAIWVGALRGFDTLISDFSWIGQPPPMPEPPEPPVPPEEPEPMEPEPEEPEEPEPMEPALEPVADFVETEDADGSTRTQFRRDYRGLRRLNA